MPGCGSSLVIRISYYVFYRDKKIRNTKYAINNLCMKPEPISNSKLTLLRKLNQKKYRQQEQLFLLEGARAVEQVLQNKVVVVKALIFDEDQQYWQQQVWDRYAGQVDTFRLAADYFAEVTDTDNPQGVLAMCAIPNEADLDSLCTQKGVIVALDAVQDPGNLGTIIRTASWFGVEALLSGKGTVDLFHPKVVRGTAGATGVIPHKNGKLGDMLPQFEQAGWPVFLLDAGADARPLAEVPSLEKAVIVVGNEAHGVDSGLFTPQRTKVRIEAPSRQTGVESLNAAVATSIALHEFSARVKAAAGG